MLENSHSWNHPLLSNIFHPKVVTEILKIKISPSSRIQSLFWSPSKLGIFTTKSAYLTNKSKRFLQNEPHHFLWKNLCMPIFIIDTSSCFGKSSIIFSLLLQNLILSSLLVMLLANSVVVSLRLLVIFFLSVL